MHELLQQEQWRIIDQSIQGIHLNALYSFGMDDALCAAVGGGMAPPTVRAWVHRDTIVLGIQDTKLPYLKEGLQYIENQGYDIIVRNSGGLAVVLDEGVLNITLIFPENEKGIDINRGYEAMWRLVQEMFSDFPILIEAREITGSYCPGSYDLSIDGKKFAGISQRRLRNGVAVQIYLCVNGSGSTRAKVIKEFYTISQKNEETKYQYPVINPAVMASLTELLQRDLTIQDVMIRLLHALKNKGKHLYMGELTEDEANLFAGYYNRVVERNEKVIAEVR